MKMQKKIVLNAVRQCIERSRNAMYWA